MSSSLEVTTRREGPVAVLGLVGDVSADGEAAVTGAYDGAVADGATAVLFDLAGAEYINTSGISVLISVAMSAKQAGRPLLVCGASDHYKKVYDLVRFSSFVSMFDSESDALASLA